jgi:hypothetical protein
MDKYICVLVRKDSRYFSAPGVAAENIISIQLFFPQKYSFWHKIYAIILKTCSII